MILDFHIEPGEREIPSDFASRLSTASCRDDLWEFFRDFGLDGQGIVDGAERAVEALAELARVDARDMLLEAYRPINGKREFAHKGQHLVHHNLTRSRVRACPHCMADDIERLDIRKAARPHRRSEWIVGALRTCANHKVALVELGDGGPARFKHDTSRAFAFAVTRLPTYLKKAQARAPSPFESYVVARLAGVAASPWMDGLPFHAALRLALIVGAIVIHGPGVNLDGLDDAQRWESEAAGFEVLSGGEARIRSFLDELQDAFARSRSPSGPRVLFGRLYEFLAYENDAPGYQPMRDLILDHVNRTLPIGTRLETLSPGVASRRVHSVHSAAKEFGLQPSRLRKLLKETGIITSQTDGMSNGRVLFDADTAEATIRDIASSLTLGEATKHLDVRKDHLSALIAAGYLKPMIAGGTDVLKDYVFRLADLEAFLSRLRRVAPTTEAEMGRAEPLPRAAKVTCRKLVDVVGMVLDGKLARIGVRQDAKGLNSILLDVVELKSLITGSQSEWLNLREAEKELHVTTSVLMNLITNGLISVHTIKNPIHGGRQTVVHPSSIEAFNETYITIFNLAKEKRTQIHYLNKMLIDAGVTPVASPASLGCTLYLRSSVNI